MSSDIASEDAITVPETPPMRWGDYRDEDVDVVVADERKENVSSTMPPTRSWTQTLQDATMIGRVKWFNDKLGYGFITVVYRDGDGTEEPWDVFVHHTGLRPLSSEHRTLIEGEYVGFVVTDGPHRVQAVNVTGVFGGPLMCDVLARRIAVEAQQDENDAPDQQEEAYPTAYRMRNGQPRNVAKYDKTLRAQMNRARRAMSGGGRGGGRSSSRGGGGRGAPPPPPPR